MVEMEPRGLPQEVLEQVESLLTVIPQLQTMTVVQQVQETPQVT
jgi:hypothetical protein